jgi:hypothetical protein
LEQSIMGRRFLIGFLTLSTVAGFTLGAVHVMRCHGGAHGWRGHHGPDGFRDSIAESCSEAALRVYRDQDGKHDHAGKRDRRGHGNHDGHRGDREQRPPPGATPATPPAPPAAPAHS